MKRGLWIWGLLGIFLLVGPSHADDHEVPERRPVNTSTGASSTHPEPPTGRPSDFEYKAARLQQPPKTLSERQWVPFPITALNEKAFITVESVPPGELYRFALFEFAHKSALDRTQSVEDFEHVEDQIKTLERFFTQVKAGGEQEKLFSGRDLLESINPRWQLALLSLGKKVASRVPDALALDGAARAMIRTVTGKPPVGDPVEQALKIAFSYSKPKARSLLLEGFGGDGPLPEDVKFYDDHLRSHNKGESIFSVPSRFRAINEGGARAYQAYTANEKIRAFLKLSGNADPEAILAEVNAHVDLIEKLGPPLPNEAPEITERRTAAYRALSNLEQGSRIKSFVDGIKGLAEKERREKQEEYIRAGADFAEGIATLISLKDPKAGAIVGAALNLKLDIIKHILLSSNPVTFVASVFSSFSKLIAAIFGGGGPTNAEILKEVQNLRKDLDQFKRDLFQYLEGMTDHLENEIQRVFYVMDQEFDDLKNRMDKLHADTRTIHHVLADQKRRLDEERRLAGVEARQRLSTKVAHAIQDIQDNDNPHAVRTALRLLKECATEDRIDQVPINSLALPNSTGNILEELSPELFSSLSNDIRSATVDEPQGLDRLNTLSMALKALDLPTFAGVDEFGEPRKVHNPYFYSICADALVKAATNPKMASHYQAFDRDGSTLQRVIDQGEILREQLKGLRTLARDPHFVDELYDVVTGDAIKGRLQEVAQGVRFNELGYDRLGGPLQPAGSHILATHSADVKRGTPVSVKICDDFEGGEEKVSQLGLNGYETSFPPEFRSVLALIIPRRERMREEISNHGENLQICIQNAHVRHKEDKWNGPVRRLSEGHDEYYQNRFGTLEFTFRIKRGDENIHAFVLRLPEPVRYHSRSARLLLHASGGHPPSIEDFISGNWKSKTDTYGNYTPSLEYDAPPFDWELKQFPSRWIYGGIFNLVPPISPGDYLRKPKKKESTVTDAGERWKRDMIRDDIWEKEVIPALKDLAEKNILNDPLFPRGSHETISDLLSSLPKDLLSPATFTINPRVDVPGLLGDGAEAEERARFEGAKNRKLRDKQSARERLRALIVDQTLQEVRSKVVAEYNNTFRGKRELPNDEHLPDFLKEMEEKIEKIIESSSEEGLKRLQLNYRRLLSQLQYGSYEEEKEALAQWLLDSLKEDQAELERTYSASQGKLLEEIRQDLKNPVSITADLGIEKTLREEYLSKSEREASAVLSLSGKFDDSEYGVYMLDRRIESFKAITRNLLMSLYGKEVPLATTADRTPQALEKLYDPNLLARNISRISYAYVEDPERDKIESATRLPGRKDFIYYNNPKFHYRIPISNPSGDDLGTLLDQAVVTAKDSYLQLIQSSPPPENPKFLEVVLKRAKRAQLGLFSESK